MTEFPPAEAEHLGQRLYSEGFRPLPDVNDDGQLIGTILWRQNGAFVEYLALRTNGFALAMRAEARYSYRTPQLHGPVVGHRSGHALDTLGWLLATAGTTQAPRPSPRPRPHGQHHRRDDGGNDHQ